MLTETAEDQYTSEQTYEQDDFNTSSMHDVGKKVSQNLAGSLLGRSYLTKNSKGTMDSGVTGNNFAEDFAS